MRTVVAACYITHTVQLRSCRMCGGALGKGAADMGTDGFKHITVNAPEEDDVVIQAGISHRKDEPASAPAAVSEVEPAPVADASAMDVSVVADGSSDAAAHEKHAGKSAREKGRSRETTLADLEGEPMPLAQRIVIAAAIVCIIGAFVYYFMFMR